MQTSKRQVFPFSFRVGMPRLFSGDVEGSPRLRILVLATFWLVALSVAWVGGSPWSWLGGGIAATCGHVFSWHRRNRTLGAWTLALTLMIIILTAAMWKEVMGAFNGNWLPLAHFLLLVQAIASFDMRTRGGLYNGLALSGIVLFFSSHQAFNLSFSIFLVGYAVFLMAFLATALLEDESGAAKVRPPGRGWPLIGFWSGTAAAVLLLAAGAFLLLPRGASDAGNYQQVNALPITGSSGQAEPQSVARLPGGPQEAPSRGDPRSVSTPSEGPRGGVLPAAIDGPDSDGIPSAGPQAEERPAAGDSPGPALERPEGASSQRVILGTNAGPAPVTPVVRDGAVMHVRSPVASYWRGQVFDTFDGTMWQPERRTGPGGHLGPAPGDLLRYVQTYFIHQPEPGTLFSGYRGVDVRSSEEALSLSYKGEAFSYKVVSAQPDLIPEHLRKDRFGRAPERYYRLPNLMGWLPGLADEITAGADTDFDRTARIVEFLRRYGQYDESASNQLDSSARLDEFLIQGEPGTSVDFATATVMLARAAGLPARLASGYLPGERDPLSGSYSVDAEDAHAWAEVLFQKHGWVPFDGSPRSDHVASSGAAGGQLPGVKHLFESSVGDDVLRAVVLAPSKLPSGFKDAFNSPLSIALAAMAAGALLTGLGWLTARLMWKRRTDGNRRWSYSRLPGSGRDEMLRIYRRVGRQLTKKGAAARRPGQTLQQYAHAAMERVSGADQQLAWFTEAAMEAAYNPRWGTGTVAEQTVQEAKARFISLKADLG